MDKLLFALILLLTAGIAWAQATAQLNGTVRDSSGAVLPGVTVTVTQTDTGLVRTTVTDESGAYLLTNAVPAVGSAEESVTVEAAAPLVDVKSAGSSTVVNNEAILELPLHHHAGGDPRIVQFGVKYAF